MSRVRNVMIGSARRVMGWMPDRLLPGGGVPDPLIERRNEVGRATSRLDGPLKVTGRAPFVTETVMDGQVCAALVYSTITRGRITRLDTRAAEASPGVVLVLTHRNMPRLGIVPMPGGANLFAPGNSGLPIMQDPEVRYNGQVVAAVLAETQEQADHAATLIEIDYAARPAATRFEEAKADARTPASILIERNHVSIGGAERRLSGAVHRVDQVYRTPRHNHNAIELHGVTAAWDGDSLLVHDTTQLIAREARGLATVFGLKDEQVRVVSPFIGGGFGGKGLWDHQIIAVAAARVAGRPVRLRLSREGVYRIIGGRSPSEQRVAVGADADGRFTALIHTGYTVMPAYGACPEQFTMGTRTAYRADSFELLQRHLDLDIVPNTFMRTPGETIGTFAVESAIDELADAMDADPVELRLRNLPDRHPISGAPFSQHALHQAFVDGAARFGWDRRTAKPGERRDGEWLIGMGCASGGFPYARMPGANVRLTLRRDGTVEISCSAQDMGMGTTTVQAQHAADRLGLPLDRITFTLGDSALPASPMAGGSSQTASIMAAVMSAAGKLRDELLKLAGPDSPVAGLRADAVTLTGGGVTAPGDRHDPYTAILARAGRDEVTVTATGAPPLEFLKYTMHSSSAIFCEVRVSEITGEVRVNRLLGSFDCGTVLNPKTAASQLRGGMIMGLGVALTEETLFDERTGRIMNPSLADYHIPAHLDVPDIEVIWTGIPDPHSPLGARGLGELGTSGVAAAIANAVFNATGTRVRDLPITLDKLL
ncbi:xanthine dehydrogenase family protein molybdopterin-binding subunit [Catenuloplanes atrovinosus]|uniref:Xanthine dehydrogenase YagR molybdenum-binding subunit n=1 Tax=Catenuloplanes atrovinosus TaxID=137266 RepID=A0AAE4C9F9_9ACTN|nr:xanthine dehydrogenase family protein molybdopterin-binding subunit [Catenuloplanes atrovinosus]MDR7275772.1 xanthine dehydrogenase YagR molybdenum-binding subunit [Catenuloplanes atrovinosus]